MKRSRCCAELASTRHRGLLDHLRRVQCQAERRANPLAQLDDHHGVEPELDEAELWAHEIRVESRKGGDLLLQQLPDELETPTLWRGG